MKDQIRIRTQWNEGLVANPVLGNRLTLDRPQRTAVWCISIGVRETNLMIPLNVLARADSHKIAWSKEHGAGSDIRLEGTYEKKILWSCA